VFRHSAHSVVRPGEYASENDEDGNDSNKRDHRTSLHCFPPPPSEAFRPDGGGSGIDPDQDFSPARASDRPEGEAFWRAIMAAPRASFGTASQSERANSGSS
jgi:hypothetical protein